MYDEPVTLHIAQRIYDGELPYVDFFEHHSPLPWYILAPFSPFSLWRLQRAFIALLGALALVGLYHLSSRAWGFRAGLLAVLLGGLSPLWQHQGNMLIHDSFLLVALTATLIIWWHVQKKPTTLGWLLVGMSAGLMILSKQTGILSALALGLITLHMTRSLRAIAAYLIGLLLPSLPLLFLFSGNYDLLYQGLVGWNATANAYLPSNPKLAPFFNDVFSANPVLWSAGVVVGVGALTLLSFISPRVKSINLLRAAGLIVLFTLGFNWFISSQTFGQYYLQAVIPLILLSAWGLDSFLRSPLPKVVRYASILMLLYLGVLNPLMNVITPWTPDQKEKLAISSWLREEVGQGMVWEPWTYYSYLAELDFDFYYPFLSVHSMRNDPSLPTIDGQSFIPLDQYLDENQIEWVVVHQPLLPGLQQYLDRLFKAGPDDWQIVQTFQVTRYASEAGMQNHLWTPWWKPEEFFEEVTIVRRHPGQRQGGLVGQITIRNPGRYPNLFLEIRHMGGVDRYHLDDSSEFGQVYRFGWHQTGHSFFLSGGVILTDHRPFSNSPSDLVIKAIFADNQHHESPFYFQIQLKRDSQGRFCPKCTLTLKCERPEQNVSKCEPTDIQEVLNVEAKEYISFDQ
jgi:Dolichyl-phosphate-mannose-protein mannosyltransferase